MSIIRFVLLSAAVLSAPISLVQAAGPLEFPAQYASGSENKVAAGATGTLDLSDVEALVFQSDKGAFHIAFSQLTSAKILDREECQHTAGSAQPQASLGPAKKQACLAVNFRDAEGNARTVTFRMPGEMVGDVSNEIGQLIGTNNPTVRDYWWGDRYWRTGRTTQHQ